jgi:hypothetical protein
MKTIIAIAAVIATLTGYAVAQEEDPQQPTSSPGVGLTMRTPKPLGCFSDPGNMWDMGPYTYQSKGWCQPLCVRQGAQYFGIVNGTNCFCGNQAPNDDDEEDQGDCNVTCSGIDTELCKCRLGSLTKDVVFANLL